MGKHSGGGGNSASSGGMGTLSSGKMKVTVCFGNVRVIVPCSDQEMLVRDLIHQATLRYKKAAGKSQDSWVVVHKLKSQSDGGILDPDDKLIDVADDREQIMAIYEEDHDGMPSLQHNAGDGTSASSVGTNSPDIFQGTEHKFQPFARTDIEITGEELNNGLSGTSGPSGSGGLTLQVRRGSEPALNRLSPVHLSSPDASKRWSAAPVIDEDKQGAYTNQSVPDNSTNRVMSNGHDVNEDGSGTNSTYYGGESGANQIDNEGVHSNGNQQTRTENNYNKFIRNKSAGSVLNQNNGKFSRDYHRLSMQFFSDGSSRWADAADRALCLSLRKEPVGATASPTSEASDSEHERRELNDDSYYKPDIHEDRMEVEVILQHEAGPLGIHLVPEHNEHGKNQGLIVQSVEKGGRVDRDGCLSAMDKIVEINGSSLLGVPFQAAQDLFRQGLSSDQLRLKVVKPANNQVSSDIGVDKSVCVDGEEKENMVHSQEKIVGDCKLATVSSTKKSPAQAAPASRPGATTTSLITSNTRKIGRKYEIDLQKGPQGLGFSITTRDNPAGGNCPIYIKNILPTGAAIDDGRLRPGDRLLEVNGIEITGKTQSEAVSILRNIPQGGIVKLVVSRQERVDLSPKLPRQIPPEKVSEDVQPVPWTEKEVLTYDIPVLDTEKAGLGISVKGKTATQAQRGMIDMGIFIKSVIHGGAASRDTRLKPNDQLLSVNGVSLQNCSNTYAMETLRKTMTQDGPKPKPGFITLTIARRVPTSSAPTTDLSGCGSSASGDEMDSWGSKNISMSADGSKLLEVSDNSHPPPVTSTPLGNQISPSNQYHQQHSNINGSSNRMVSPITVRQEELSLPSSAMGSAQNVINRSRSSSLRKIDVLKGKFENAANANFPNHHQQMNPPPHLDPRMALELPRNPVLDRLTGKNTVAARSDSYYRATNETVYSPGSPPNQIFRPENIPISSNYSPRRNSGMVVQNSKGEMILLEDDYSAPLKPPRRSSRSSTPEDTLNSRRRMSSDAQPISPAEAQAALSDVTYASQTSLEDAGGFSRDAFGRQSMSEKRHATLDAKSTDTYQRNKKVRDERGKHKQGSPEDNSNKTVAQRLAEEQNLQDQWARRGVKRPLSTDDDLPCPDSNKSNRNLSIINLSSPGSEGGRSPQWPEIHLANKISLTKGKRGDRLGLGDQLLQLLHHLGQKRTPRVENSGLTRTNSADSIVDSLKMRPPHPHGAERSERKPKSNKKDIGPNLGMKKSSSLESLQTMVQEIVVQEDMKSGYVPPRSGPQAVRVIRGRGCNESFRQAVDRSYEAPLDGIENQMETLAEEETESCISGAPSGRHVRIDVGEGDAEEKSKTGKKKQGLFRGLGSMFRFGRHRKTNPNAAHDHRQNEVEWDGTEKYVPAIDKVQEQYRRLAEKRRDDGRGGHYAANANDYSRPEEFTRHPQNPNRASSASYSTGAGSMRVKTSSRKPIDMPDKDMNGNPPNLHLRSASYDVYNEMTRPGSRVGFVDPKKYSHYINYEEIRHHLNDPMTERSSGQGLTDAQILQMRNTVVEQRKKAILESRRHQQHYHSQRRENPRERQERPVSNFYEYESVQAAMHPQPGSQPQGVNPMNLGGQSNYTIAMQQQQNKRLHINNGVTLPSPTVPLGLRQISPSQFQAVPMGHQHPPSRVMVNEDRGRNANTLDSSQMHMQQQQQRRAQQNSLPRRQQKDSGHYNSQSSQGTPQPPPNHRHTLQPHQFPIAGIPGRYPIGPPSQQSSHSHHSQNISPQQQMNMYQTNHHHPHHSQQQQQQVQHSQQQPSSMRLSQHQQPHHSNNAGGGGGGGGMYSPSSVNLSVGSKV